MEKVLVLGGTGFLGYHTVEELLKQGYKVKALSLPPMPDENLFSNDRVEIVLKNINELPDEEVLDLLSDVDGLVYAIGADERVVPNKPAFSFFYEANVLPTQRLARLSAEAGLESFVIFGSYFAEFAERIDDIDIISQAYPKTRILQEEMGFAEGEGKMRVSSLRLPYIFGTMPGRDPLWTMFTEQIKDAEVYPVLKGGTAAVTANQVAQAAVGALEKGKHRATYPLGGINITYKEFTDMMVEALGQEGKTDVPLLPLEEMLPIYEEMDREADKQGKEHGIHMAISAKVNTRDLFIDPKKPMEELGYEEDDVYESIRKTLKLCAEKTK